MMQASERHAMAVRSYFEGINAERYEDVATLFAPDGELHAPGTEPRRGREAIAGYFAEALRPYPEHFDDPIRTLFAGDTVMVEIHYKGRHASGTAIEFDAVDVIDFDAAGKIVKLSSWYDSHAVRKALRRIRDATDAGTA
jgi:uncharacterized protein (TIGR02246 family)